MSHAIVYYGKAETNFRKLRSGTSSYIGTRGERIEVRNSSADGIRFAYMVQGTSEFLGVKVEDIVLENPIALQPSRHTDGKSFAPNPTTFGDASARRLLDDMARANPRQRKALLALSGSLPGARKPVVARTRAAGVKPSTRRGAVGTGDMDHEAMEGKRLLVSHIRLERSRKIIDAKRAQVLAETGGLQCEACGFDFREEYPGLGIDFCEVHHNKPLGGTEQPSLTHLRDLSILCSNCHRMIHRTPELLIVSEFQLRVCRKGLRFAPEATAATTLRRSR